MSDVKIKAELDEFNFSFYKSDIEKCFEVSEFTETLYSLRFKERYEKSFPSYTSNLSEVSDYFL